MEASVKLHDNIWCYFVIPCRFHSISSYSTVWFNHYFCFISFYGKYDTHLPNYKIPSENFLTWLVGLTEGKGYFIVNNRGNLVFASAQAKTDKQVLEFIQEIIGFGKLIP